MKTQKLPDYLWNALQESHRVGWKHGQGEKCQLEMVGCEVVVAAIHRALHAAELRGKRKAAAVCGLICFTCNDSNAKHDGWGCCAICGCDVAAVQGTKAARESVIEAATSALEKPT